MSKFAVHGGRINLDDRFEWTGSTRATHVRGSLTRQMGDEAGEDLGPEFEDMVSRIERGEDPDSVMSDGDDDDFGGDDDF